MESVTHYCSMYVMCSLLHGIKVWLTVNARHKNQYDIVMGFAVSKNQYDIVMGFAVSKNQYDIVMGFAVS